MAKNNGTATQSNSGNGAPQRKDMTGVLFVNDKRETENHPHYTGRILINGKQYSLSAWEKESREGKPYLSLAVREWVERPQQDGEDLFR